ncbi:Nramp-domain-containing protein [Rhizoclosmatium globosum]|uniref:Nramp-domain-containing protein n=1 Tax=Rhizoclosmatium globosum TaxID=329046 RepID=A0A1Y2CJQ2_9FUNG|nr:Nramp-domain-containing protein [Rhizoclosmatium globosum]|eukprot:ORY47248.1 Nramp-domain-containing protein [Rhizoclosmatium globosum]
MLPRPPPSHESSIIVDANQSNEQQRPRWTLRNMGNSAKRLAAIVLATIGPGGFVAVGYMDPGNWATDLQGGTQFNYSLLFVVLLSGLCAIALQSLTIRLGIVTGKDLPQMCRKELHPVANLLFWILAEVAIICTDLAEVIGAAMSLKLLFGLPITYGVLIMGLDVLIVLFGWNQKYLRYFEIFIFILILGVGVCFMALLPRLGVDWGQAFKGYLPSSILVTDSTALYTCLGILGATVMPHNLYLHSSLVHFKSPSYRERLEKNKVGAKKMDQVQEPRESTENVTQPLHPDAEITPAALPPTRTESANTLVTLVTNPPSPTTPTSLHKTPRSLPDHLLPLLKQCLHHLNVDSIVSLLYATIINSFILITAAAAFYTPDQSVSVGGIEDAYDLLMQMLGSGGATLFAVGLFFSGQCSTVTGTLAGQVVMEGFLGGEDTLDAVPGDEGEFLVSDGVKRKEGVAGEGNRVTARVQSATGKMVLFFRKNMWARRLVTRGVAIVPALIVVQTQGSHGIDDLLVLSQVILGVLLPFAVWPLVIFTSSRRVMTVRYVEGDGSRYSSDGNMLATTEDGEGGGEMRVFDVCYANSWPFTILVMLIAVAVTALNLYLLAVTIKGR